MKLNVLIVALLLAPLMLSGDVQARTKCSQASRAPRQTMRRPGINPPLTAYYLKIRKPFRNTMKDRTRYAKASIALTAWMKKSDLRGVLLPHGWGVDGVFRLLTDEQGVKSLEANTLVEKIEPVQKYSVPRPIPAPAPGLGEPIYVIQ